jgi:hypothetical protein
MFDGVATSPYRAALYVAITQYSLALRQWAPGYETAAVSHLFMGMEARKETAVLVELASRALSRTDLARQWGVKTSALENEARLCLLFQHSVAVHNDAKDASNAFEHGDPDFGIINKKAINCRDETRQYLREAIVRFINLTTTTRSALLSPNIANPPLPGGLTAISGDLPPDFDFQKGAELDFMPFAFDLKPTSIDLNDAGSTYVITMQMNAQARMSDVNVDTSYHVQGTNLAKPPEVSGVTRSADKQHNSVPGNTVGKS